MTCAPLPTSLRALRNLAIRTALIAGLATALGGCQYVTTQEVTGAVPVDYRQRHPIAIKEGQRTVEMFIGRSRGALTPAQRGDVVAFAQTWAREATGGIIIEVPTAAPNARAAHDAAGEVQVMLAAAGVPAHAVDVRLYRPAPGKLATVKLDYPVMTASVGPCGMWPQDLGASWQRAYSENRQYWNFGCAHQRYLAAMVENPADLVQPRGETSIYAARRSVALDKFRKGEGTATNYPQATQGKISGVGQ
jgi:pilus assembly protein CpaD